MGTVDLLKKVLSLAVPFGKRRLVVVFLVMVVQGVFQVVGVASIFPFLALAADPSQLTVTPFGSWLVSGWLSGLDQSQLLLVAGVFAALMLVVSNVMNILGEFIRGQYAHHFGHWLRMRLLNQMLAQPYRYFLEHNSAVLLKKIYSDVLAYTNSVLLPLLESIARLLTSTLLVGTLLVVNLWVTVFSSLVICGFYAAVYYSLRHKREQLSHEFKHSWRRCAVELQQLLGGIKLLKVHEAEVEFAERFERPSENIARHASWLPVYMNAPRYVIEPVLFSAVIAVVVYLDSRGDDLAKVLPTMGIMALAGYRLLPSLQLLYGQLTQISAARYTVEEVCEEFSHCATYLVRKKKSASERSLEWSDSIELREVCFTYRSADVPVLDRVSLKIKKNTSVAFVGATGSGKSTIIDLLTGLHVPDSGEILVDGRVVDGQEMTRWRASIGYVEQSVFLLDDTIARNIAIGVEPDRERVRQAAATAQILEFIERNLSDGFDTLVGERGVRLSGGQRQRIALARALYRRPSVLIFDEATSALDSRTEARFMEAIYSLRQSMTIIMVAHRISTIKGCDQICELRDGRVIHTSFERLAETC